MRHPLTKACGKAVLKAIGVTFLLLFLWYLATGPDLVTVEPTTPSESKAPSLSTQVETLIDWYGCWTDDGPRNQIPTHAIVSYDGTPNYVSATLGLDVWLHPHRNPGMTIHAFCP